jgi:hypothetical protein
MRSATILAAALAAVLWTGGPAAAAQKWGLPNEETARFEAEVVDVLCELTGDCPDDCGGGARQLGLVTDEGRLVLPLKNFVPFAGAAAELIDFCGERVIADGVFTTNRGLTVFALQFVRRAPDGPWRRANRFLDQWAAEHGVAKDSPTAKKWFRNDPRIRRLVDEQGKLGLGPEADEAYLEE